MGTIFITHHHDDHTAGLGTLMSAAWDNQRIKPINVYGPPRTKDLVKAAVQYFTISAPRSELPDQREAFSDSGTDVVTEK